MNLFFSTLIPISPIIRKTIAFAFFLRTFPLIPLIDSISPGPTPHFLRFGFEATQTSRIEKSRVFPILYLSNRIRLFVVFCLEKVCSKPAHGGRKGKKKFKQEERRLKLEWRSGTDQKTWAR